MQDLTNIADFLRRASERTGFKRERYVESNMPTSFGNIAIMLFYGDLRSQFVLSSLLLHRIKELYPSKYLILSSFPNQAGFYPYVDEYWSPQDEATTKLLADGACDFGNAHADKVLFQEQQLNRYFENILHVEDYYKYYQGGFSKEFIDEFKWIIYKLPSIPSSKIEFNRVLSQRAGKVFIYPSRTMRCWNKGRVTLLNGKKEFWHELAKGLIAKGITPVVYQDYGSFDISPVLQDKCVYVREEKILDVFGAMRTTGCVLDVFNGLSRWASAARTPFIACAERHYYAEMKEYELDDLCNNTLPHKYIFSFPTIIESGHWQELIDTMVAKVEGFIPELNRDTWPSAAEQALVVPYDLVRKRKQTRIGARFIKVERL